MEVIWWVGLACISYVALKLAIFVYVHFLRDNEAYWRSFQGQWALVTASSAGCGRSIAIALGKRGINVIVTGRNAERLQEVSDQLKRLNVKCLTVSVDFLDPEAAAIIQKKMKAEGVAEIAILINNVGGIPDLSAQEAFSAMMELSVESADKVSRLNVGTPVSMVRTFVPAMVQRKRGCVIFVGSLSRLAPAYLSHYGSDKAKLATMAYGMNLEYAPLGIRVEIMESGEMSTPGTKNPPVTIHTCSSDRFAEDMLRTSGLSYKMTPYWFHAVEGFGLALLPEYVAGKIATTVVLNARDKITQRENSKKSQ